MAGAALPGVALSGISVTPLLSANCRRSETRSGRIRSRDGSPHEAETTAHTEAKLVLTAERRGGAHHVCITTTSPLGPF
jgi:hypothetical protein